MNKTVMQNGIPYTYIETLPLTDGSGFVVVCQNERGERFACPLENWKRQMNSGTAPSASVDYRSTSDEKIALFRSLFRGRGDVYARRWYNAKTGKSGYSPACGNEWRQGLCDKRNTPCAQCPNRALLPLTDTVLYRHLEGRDEYARDVIGVYPMLLEETARFLAVDFDGEGWQADAAAFADACRAFDITPSVERSRSGNGAHVWLFFADAVPAAGVRKLGSGLLTKVMEGRPELKMRSYDRLFPNQDTLPKGGFGNLIALPLQGKARKAGNSVFVDERFQPYSDQWAYLSCVPCISNEQLQVLLYAVCPNGELGELTPSEEDERKPWEITTLAALTAEDFPPAVALTLADGLYVERKGISARAQNRIKRLAAFRNPDFYKAQAMRLPTYHKPRIIDTAQLLPDYIKLPRGCLFDLEKLLPCYQLDDQRTAGRTIDVSFRGALRAEQQIAAEAMLAHEVGVLSAVTAFGKTAVGAYMIGARKVNTLILVHSTALLTQWKRALEQFLVIGEPLPALPPKRVRKQQRDLIGQLGGGKKRLNGIVDIALMQSLTDGDGVNALVREYGMVLCDECHHVPAVSFEQVLAAVSAKYVYGLSATPIRQDGHQPILFMQCGPIRYQVDAATQASQLGVARFIIPRFTSLRVPNADKLPIQSLYAKLTESEMRNRFIIADVQNALRDGRTPLVLTERKEHAALLSELLRDACPRVFLLTGGDGQKAKREKLEALRTMPASEPLVVVATGKYIGEGFDEPRLDTLFLAMPVAWRGTLTQYVGRLHRERAGKREVIVYDYVDIHIGVLERMYQKRLRGYKDLGYQVKAAVMDDRPGIIFDSSSFDTPFAADIASAVCEILLVSPFLRKARVTSLLKLMEEPRDNGVCITVVTRPTTDYKPEQQAGVARLLDALQAAGVRIVTHCRLHQKYAVIDQTVVWYGSISFLSFGSSEESVMRFENSDLAGQLLDAINYEEKRA